MRSENFLLRLLQAQPPLQIIKRSSDRQRSRSQNHRRDAVKEPLAQDRRDINRGGFQEYAAAAPLPPIDEVPLLGFEHKLERLSKLAGALRQAVDLFRALFQPPELRFQALEGVEQSRIRGAVRFQKLLAIAEARAAFALGKSSKKCSARRRISRT